MPKSLESILEVDEKQYRYFPISQIDGASELPFSLKVLLENVLRSAKTEASARAYAERIVEAADAAAPGEEIEFCPARVLYQDFTGVPVFVDFAVMREAFSKLGGDAKRINPNIECDLIIDHSVIADEAGTPECMSKNVAIEFERNAERYEFLKWAQASFENVRIVPPGQGICHQLNIEQFAEVVKCAEGESTPLAYFDTVVGTDSHTPTVNGLGVLGWGVGGIEAEAAALGQPITTLVPKVVGVKLTGALAAGVQAMDVALTFAEMLRARGVVGCFVECFGEGVSSLSATQRACISNMTPEYGSTCTLFPIDERTIEYLRLTGRAEEQVALIREYAKAQGVWGATASSECKYAEVIDFDLSQVKPSCAGPSRPHARVDVGGLKARFHEIAVEHELDLGAHFPANFGGETCELTHGDIAIAAVTSCTTATDSKMMLAAGLVARNAAAKGLHPKPWVKTIFAPGSHATEELLRRAGLLSEMEKLGYFTCGFGCMSCIGNSGSCLPQVCDAATKLEFASVLSGNRNFDGRISPDVAQNYLMSPAYVIALSIAGTVNFNIETDALGTDEQGNPVYFKDIAPCETELVDACAKYVNASLYEQGSANLFEGSAEWKSLKGEASDSFSWDETSTYVRRPPYFDGMAAVSCSPKPIENAYVLAFLGDFITTDHISPAGAIAPESPAAEYLLARGVSPEKFNTYGARRGNHEVMMRGTFANVKLANKLAEGKLGGWTRDILTGDITTIFDAAEHYKREGAPSVVIAGKMYGSGSSRDWAAKGPALLGVRAVIAESFERIHRSNLIGMGILPLQFLDGEGSETYSLTGDETISIESIDFSKSLPSPSIAEVSAKRKDGSAVRFSVKVRIDTPTEGEYYKHGGILQYVLRDML